MAWFKRSKPLDVTELLEFGKIVTMGDAEYRVVAVNWDGSNWSASGPVGVETIDIQLVSQVVYDRHYRIPEGT